MNAATYKSAKAILEQNLYEKTIENQKYRVTLPSKEFYIHQWNWDSATHAMGLIHIDEDRAYEELLSLFSGQWENGLIPHIIFNPNEHAYFPGPDFWDTGMASGIMQSTSGIIQPPLLAISVEYIYTRAKDRKKAALFLEKALPGLIRYHEYLKMYRDSEDCGLISIVHPWESGTDNSPRWDLILEMISLETIPHHVKRTLSEKRSDNIKGVRTHRPREDDYFRYIYLIELYKSWNWNYEKIVSQSPFAVKDILVNAIWCRANTALANLLKQTGQTQKAKRFSTWEGKTRSALYRLWDDEEHIFKLVHTFQGKKIYLKEHTIANFMPLYARAVDGKQLEILLSQLTDPKLYWSPIPFPSTALSHVRFESTRYWRGPTWPITNLFIIEGLFHYSRYGSARRLAEITLDKTMNMIETYGFFEYYHPHRGKSHDSKRALGFGSFSWSAAIYLYLYHTYQKGQRSLVS